MEDLTKSITHKALSLSSREKAVLAEQLLYSLEQPTQELDQVWAKEAENRLDALEQGKAKTVSADSMFGNNDQ